MELEEMIPHAWRELLQGEFKSRYWITLSDFVTDAYQQHIIYPPKDQLFNALRAVSPADVKVVILGQDPYHEPGQAHGLSFSVPDGVKIPPSLVNILKEIASDCGTPPATSGNLTRWAQQGVLLLNATLTVEAQKAASHQGKGWEQFTNSLIYKLQSQYNGIVFLLWGSSALQKKAFIDSARHKVLQSPHPSPLSAYRGFLGNKHFSQTNQYLISIGKSPIIW